MLTKLQSVPTLPQMVELSALPTTSEPPSSNESRIRLTKRKLDDAFHILDTAVNQSHIADQPPPPKRTNTLKSLYSTLAKYGIRTKEPKSSLSHKPLKTNTPHLNAILSRVASRTKPGPPLRSQSLSSSPTPFLPATAEYRPSSLPSFLSRLSTYKLSTYANKPVVINAVAASKCGWINDGKDRLVCGLCNTSWVVAGREGLARDAANALVEKQRTSLVEAHKTGCPWKTRQCDDSIYCTPLQSPGAMIREIKDRASSMDPVIRDVLIKHTLSATQLKAFIATVSSYTIPDLPSLEMSEPNSQHPVFSEMALLAALFGWSLVPPTTSPVLRRAATTRAPSVASFPPSQLASPIPHPQSLPGTSSVHPTSPTGDPQPTFTFHLPTKLTEKPENALLQCALCQRRIGLWSFTNRTTTPSTSDLGNQNLTGTGTAPNSPAPTTLSRPKKPILQRAFDLLKEHRSYCPYTVRSTVVPSLPVPVSSTTPNTPKRSSSTSSFMFSGHKNSSTTSLSQLNGNEGPAGSLEGWRAVLTVVLRYGMAEKQRIEYTLLSQRADGSGVDGEGDGERMEIDNVKAMVSGVKTHGGKDLLKYVRKLLS